MRSPWVGALAAVSAIAAASVLRSSDAEPLARDPAARGLDAFVHAPGDAPSGSSLPLQIEVFGFPSVTTLTPLAGATVEAVWNPESLDEASAAPPGVRGVADASGNLHLELPVPPGDDRELELLLGLRSGEHTRTRSFKIRRTRARRVELVVADRRVVPGGVASAWVRAIDVASGAPIANAAVDLSLLEGGAARYEAHLVTDAAGNATARVPIPRTEEPGWSYVLAARSGGESLESSSGDSVTMTLREETPGTPEMNAAWAADTVLAGDRAAYSILVRDALGQPVANAPLRYWIGPKGTKPPVEEKAWIAASTAALSDASGEVKGTAATPSTVVRAGTTMTLFARANVEGHDLKSETVLAVGAAVANAAIVLERRAIVPGVEQHGLLRVKDGHGDPVTAPFVVDGDGLHAEVTTDRYGEAAITWAPPIDLGTSRDVGPCAGGVAASVRIKPKTEIASLAGHREGFELCLPVDRDAPGILRLDRTSAREGDTLHVWIDAAAEAPRAKGARAPSVERGPFSVALASPADGRVASVWMTDATKGVDVAVPRGEPGIWRVTAAGPRARSGAVKLAASILVAPKLLPKVTARVTGGRLVPGGEVEVEATLVDEKGAPLVGAIAATMIDARGGGSLRGLVGLDTRRTLCAPFGVAPERCDAIVEGARELDALRRVGLDTPALLAPLADPGAHVTQDLRATFAGVVMSLEGAVFESTASPDRLRDARRREGRGWTYNPELMTLVTGAMSAPPETPGGEPFTLADVLAIDPQATFDNVARRVTRLKLFRLLTAYRTFRKSHALDADEPALRDPNAVLRRLVREETLHESDLLDPWGGTIQFVRATGASIPFLTVKKGFELHAPGPDGKLGTPDDVKDPFERVLKSGTPYAVAVQEDRVVDAKDEVEVSDATVDAWSNLFTKLFGDAIGDSFGAGGLGLGGIGEGGGGSTGEGFGIGHGRIGRASWGVDTGVAFWQAPTRTDDHGRVRFRIPLRDIETTWRLGVVATPDGATPATTAIDLGVALPVSVRAEAGASWIEGDAGNVALTIRNRTNAVVHAKLRVAASGAAELARKEPERAIDVAAASATIVKVGVRAKAQGVAVLEADLDVAGQAGDRLTHRWEVRPPGEPTDFTSSLWIEDEGDLALTLPEASLRLVGAPRVVLERGPEVAILGALDALDPDALASPAALADAVEVAMRVSRWAAVARGEHDPLVARAEERAKRAVGRIAAFASVDPSRGSLASRRAALRAPLEVVKLLNAPADCPTALESIVKSDAADAEPEPAAGAQRACWDAIVSDAAAEVQSDDAAVEPLARLLLAVADRPHRAELAASLAERLRERVKLRASGAIVLDAKDAASRATRSIVYAALLRGSHLGKPSAAPPDRLAAWIGVQRDTDGGYGSSAATRMVVRALLAEPPSPTAPSRVIVRSGGTTREIAVGDRGRFEIELEPSARAAHVEVKGPGVVARLERPVLRLWSHPPDAAASPLRVEATWPSDARAGGTGVLHLAVRQATLGLALVDLRVPLPPGVTLAEGIAGARVVQGQLSIRRPVSASGAATIVDVPLRFGLAGSFTTPEIRARVAQDELPRAIAPAGRLVVRE